jgi:hypothetical protein
MPLKIQWHRPPISSPFPPRHVVLCPLCMYTHLILTYLFSYHASTDAMSPVVGGKEHIIFASLNQHLPRLFNPPIFICLLMFLWNFEHFCYLGFITKNHSIVAAMYYKIV